jgi:uncharacterized membrane protein HdeD (DUF308 family)
MFFAISAEVCLIKIKIMTSSPFQTQTALRNLYFTRAAFSIVWVILIALFANSNFTVASILLIIYPLWDVIATIIDIRRVPGQKPQYVNAVISTLTTIAVAIAIQRSVPEAILVFGVWAILTGLIQLILALKRKASGGQWPMIISGAQSMIGGSSFIYFAHDPTKGIASLAGYAAFGAFYFLLSGFRLSRMLRSK